MPHDLIVDFDGTLILENSSRELEKVVLEQLSGARRILIRAIFFSATTRFTDRLWGLISRLFYKRKDFRFRLFYWLSNDIFIESHRQLIEKTCARLNFNRELLKSVNGNDVVILSCGFDEIITHFLNVNDFKYARAEGSELKRRDGEAGLKLRSFDDKAGFMVEARPFIYWSDDATEIRVLKKRFGEMEEKVLYFGDRRIFEVASRK